MRKFLSVFVGTLVLGSLARATDLSCQGHAGVSPGGASGLWLARVADLESDSRADGRGQGADLRGPVLTLTDPRGRRFASDRLHWSVYVLGQGEYTGTASDGSTSLQFSLFFNQFDEAPLSVGEDYHSGELALTGPDGREERILVVCSYVGEAAVSE